jgi:hypothetical protein
MRRYSFRVGSIKVGSSSVETYIVIRTEDVPDREVRAKGFQPVEEALSDDEVRARFGVDAIRTVVNNRMKVM